MTATLVRASLPCPSAQLGFLGALIGSIGWRGLIGNWKRGGGGRTIFNKVYKNMRRMGGI